MKRGNNSSLCSSWHWMDLPRNNVQGVKQVGRVEYILQKRSLRCNKDESIPKHLNVMLSALPKNGATFPPWRVTWAFMRACSPSGSSDWKRLRNAHFPARATPRMQNSPL